METIGSTPVDAAEQQPEPAMADFLGEALDFKDLGLDLEQRTKSGGTLRDYLNKTDGDAAVVFEKFRKMDPSTDPEYAVTRASLRTMATYFIT